MTALLWKVVHAAAEESLLELLNCLQQHGKSQGLPDGSGNSHACTPYVPHLKYCGSILLEIRCLSNALCSLCKSYGDAIKARGQLPQAVLITEPCNQVYC